MSAGQNFQSEPEIPLTSDQTLEKLQEAIELHAHTMWRENGEDDDSTIIVHWAVPIFFRTYIDGVSDFGYWVETARAMAPHEVKGLLAEAHDWVIDMQAGGDD